MADVIPDNFLGLPHAESDYKKSRFAVIPVPYDSTTSYAVGTREGPRAIITASQQVEFCDEYFGRETVVDGVSTLDPVAPNMGSPEDTVNRVYEAAKKPVKDGKFIVGLGGEHSISSGFVRAVQQKYKKLSVLQVDAHADLRDSYQGTPYSHACVMRRIHDLGVPAVGVGIRSYSLEESQFIKKHDKKILSARMIRNTPKWIDQVLEDLTDSVFVTIDIDGFDPAYAPGTGTPEPGGLDWFQVTDLLKAVSLEKRIVGCDVVEVRPIAPNTVTEFLAARLLHRLMGLVSNAGK